MKIPWIQKSLLLQSAPRHDGDTQCLDGCLKNCSKKIQALLCRPVLQLVVSKHISWTLSSKLQSSPVQASPFPDDSFGTARICAYPLVVTSIGNHTLSASYIWN